MRTLAAVVILFAWLWPSVVGGATWRGEKGDAGSIIITGFVTQSIVVTSVVEGDELVVRWSAPGEVGERRTWLGRPTVVARR